MGLRFLLAFSVGSLFYVEQIKVARGNEGRRTVLNVVDETRNRTISRIDLGADMVSGVATDSDKVTDDIVPIDPFPQDECCIGVSNHVVVPHVSGSVSVSRPADREGAIGETVLLGIADSELIGTFFGRGNDFFDFEFGFLESNEEEFVIGDAGRRGDNDLSTEKGSRRFRLGKRFDAYVARHIYFLKQRFELD